MKITDQYRITPAGAGKTRMCWQCNYQKEDHPRRCGENHFFMLSPHIRPGSPPQVRGKPAAVGGGGCAVGITPAGAGKTQLFAFAPRRDQDHPRRCGENVWGQILAKLDEGSPPQVRGKQPTMTKDQIMQRITPAGAGKTLVEAGVNLVKGDHPRRCGENTIGSGVAFGAAGSPPQVRGKPNKSNY